MTFPFDRFPGFAIDFGMTTLHAQLGLDGLTDEELATRSNSVATAMRSSAATFASPPVTPDQLVHDATDLTTKIATRTAALAAAKSATADVNAARARVRQNLTGAGKFVETVAAGDEAKLRAGGFEPAAKAVHHADLKTPDGVTATLGDALGEVDVHWHSPRTHTVASARIDMTTDPTKPETFHQVALVTGSKATLTGLPHGTTITLRVVFIGTSGRVSAPSNLVTITV